MNNLEKARICKCGQEVEAGYYVEANMIEEYFCSDECLHDIYTKEEYNQMYDEGLAYYTEWED